MVALFQYCLENEEAVPVLKVFLPSIVQQILFPLDRRKGLLDMFVASC